MNTYHLGANSWWPPDQAAADDFMRYAAAIDADSYAATYDEITSNTNQILIGAGSGERLCGFLTDRIRNQTPTSLVRMGDGEGNILFASLGIYPALADYCLKKISQLIFGSPKLIGEHQAFFAQILHDSMVEADVLGAPVKASVLNSFQTPPEMLDVRGMCGMRGFYTYLKERFPKQGLNKTAWSTTWFSRELLPYYHTFLDELKYIGVISCYETLGSALATSYHIETSESLVIPMQASIARSTSDIRHYPEVYEKTLDRIRPPFTGAVYIVAAGPLGKAYCTTIKKRGGIAIDVGSIADVWMGITSRPGLDANFVARWRLQHQQNA